MAFLGMRGTGDWESGQDPQNWRETILYEFPNGDAPLTAILSMMESEQINSTVHNWWLEVDPTMGGAVTGVYVDAGMSTAYSYSTHQATFGVKGATIYLKVAEAVAQEVNGGAELRLLDVDRPDAAVMGKCTGVLLNGASSRISVRLLEADDNGADPSSYNLSTVDYMQISGHVQPQGAALPDAVHYNPTLYTNYTQILEEPFKLTRTARKTRLRSGDQYQQDKIKTLQRISKKLELTFLNSVLSSSTGDNGEPELTMQGIIPMIRELAPSNVADFRYDTDFAGKSWKAGGQDFLDKMIELLSRWGASERLALIGSGAARGIDQLAKTYGNINLEPGPNNTYGMHVTTWVGQITLHLKVHPLFSRIEADRYKMLILDPKNIKYLYIDDLYFKEDPTKDKAGNNSFDGTNESYLAECTLEYDFPNEFGLLDGIGQDNNLS